MSKCMMCQNDEDLRDAFEREEAMPELSEQTKKDIRRLKSFSFYLIVTPIIIFLSLILIFVF